MTPGGCARHSRRARGFTVSTLETADLFFAAGMTFAQQRALHANLAIGETVTWARISGL